jgi:hypothetical protein
VRDFLLSLNIIRLYYSHAIKQDEIGEVVARRWYQKLVHIVIGKYELTRDVANGRKVLIRN